MGSKSKPERKTMDLWPDSAQLLGLGKNAVYEAAARGEIPGAFRIGKRWLVSAEAFDRALREPAGLRPVAFDPR